MRIDNQTNRNSSNAYNKKNKSKKEIKKQGLSYDNNDQFDLSSSIVLLNQLLNKPEFHYKPVPFYFSNAAKINSENASNIANLIQQEAIYYDVNLNYDMIIDLVISHENEMNNNDDMNRSKNGNANSSNIHPVEIQKYQLATKNASYQHISLQENETVFFEEFHKKGFERNLPLELISIIVIEYFQLKQTRKINISTQQEQIDLLNELINISPNPNISHNKTLLSNILV